MPLLNESSRTQKAVHFMILFILKTVKLEGQKSNQWLPGAEGVGKGV